VTMTLAFFAVSRVEALFALVVVEDPRRAEKVRREESPADCDDGRHAERAPPGFLPFREHEAEPAHHRANSVLQRPAIAKSIDIVERLVGVVEGNSVRRGGRDQPHNQHEPTERAQPFRSFLAPESFEHRLILRDPCERQAPECSVRSGPRVPYGGRR
jgi:hypothetical protein